jgi:hypothetical protein
MHQLFRRKTPARLIVVFAMLASLLLAQGLRVCIHGATETESLGALSGAAHFETSLAADDHVDEAPSTAWHASLSVVLKQLGFKFELLAATIALLVLPLVRRALRVLAPLTSLTPRVSFCALRPPLRAPPL